MNGVFKEVKSGNIYDPYVQGALYFGKSATGTAYPVANNTLIDDFRMYNRVLNFDEIQTLYNIKLPTYTSTSISTIDSTNLQLRYDFDTDNLLLNKGLLGTSYNLTQNSTLSANGAIDINNSYLNINTSLNYSTWTEATISFNLKITALNTNWDVITYHTTGNAFIIQRNDTNYSWYISIFGSGAVTTVAKLEDFVPDNTWNHYVFTFKKEGTAVRINIYKNGDKNPTFTNLSGTWLLH